MRIFIKIYALCAARSPRNRAACETQTERELSPAAPPLLLTHEDHQPVPAAALPAVRRHLLVRGHVGHVVHLALLTLVHGLVGLLVSAAQTEASPEPSWRS